MFAARTGPWLVGLGVVLLLALGLELSFLSQARLVGPLAGTAGAIAVWLFLAFFFRDPERVPGDGIVSGADGRVLAVEAQGDRLRVSVFMGVASVHVNRIPLDARILSVTDAGGGHRVAFAPDAGANAQRRYRLETELGPVELVQVTGVLARRLVSFVRPGETRRKGERLGMIVLGSRFDVLLPRDRVVPLVRVGDRVRAGATPIARPGPP